MNLRRPVARRVPRVMWAISALWIALLLGASVLWPMTSGYDEPQHIDMAYAYSQHPFRFYGPGDLPMSQALVEAQNQAGSMPPSVRLGSVSPRPRADRPTLSELGGHQPVAGSQPNQMVQHPPLYYWTEAVLLRLPGVSHLPWDLQIWLMRLLSVIYACPVPLLCWAAGRRLVGLTRHAGSTALPVACGVIPLLLPNIVRNSAAVTNDSLLLLSSSVLLWLMSRVMTGDRSKRTAVGIASALAVSLLTKGFALAFPPIVLVAYLIAGFDRGAALKTRISAVWRPMLITLGGAAVGGLWWLRNVITYGTVQIDGFGPVWDLRLYGRPNDEGSLRHFLPTFVRGVIERFWSGFGLPDSPSLPLWSVYSAMAITVIAVGGACLGRTSDRSRPALWLLAVTVIATLGIVASGSYGTYHRWPDAVRGAQGRYLFHLIVALSVLIVLGCARMFRASTHRYFGALLLSAALIIQASAWIMILRSWYEPSGSGHFGRALSGLLAWSPLPDSLTVALVVVLPVSTAIWAAVDTTLFCCASRHRREPIPVASGAAV